jgi:1-pyrroline-5-carboxylate dehydrogenase
MIQVLPRTAISPVHFIIYRSLQQHVEDHRRLDVHLPFYSRIVGETGGKDFIVAHASADVDALAV